MTADRKFDAAFAVAILATLGASLLAGLALAPRAPAPPAPPPKPVPFAVDPGLDPFRVDPTRLDALRALLSPPEEASIGGRVAEIRRALSADPPDVVAAEASLLALAPSGEKAAPAAAEFLSDPDPSLRRAGARAAGRIGSPVLVPALAKVLLDETDWQVQADAAWALGRIGDRSAVIDLLRWRADGANEPLHPFVKIRVAEALLRLGNTSQVRWLVDAMYGSQSPVFEAECADNALREASGRSSGFDREGTRSAMQNTGLHWALWWERWEGFFRPPGPAPDRTDERRLRHRVAQALRDIGGSRYFDLFWARDLLARAGDLAVPDLTAALYEGDPARAGDPASHRRMNACEVFRMMVEIKVQPAPDKGVLAPHLNQVLAADADSAVRAAAARTVAVLGDRRSVGPLLALLSSDPDPSVRREAAKALGALGFADAVPALAKALPGATGILRFEIESALLRCRGRPHLEPIVEALAKGIEGDDRDLCEEALTRLEEETGRRTALPPRADARSRLLASWRHVARFHTLWRDLVTEHDSGGPGFAETAAKLRALLGPEVPPPPADPKAALRYYTDFRNLWKRLAALRMAVDRASQGPMDAAELAWLGEGLSALTGRANDLHPRTPQLDLNAAYDGWVAWAERNAPGCAGRQ